MPVKFRQLERNLIVISVISKGMIPKHIISLKTKLIILVSGLTGMVICLNACGYGRKGLVHWIFPGGGIASRSRWNHGHPVILKNRKKQLPKENGFISKQDR